MNDPRKKSDMNNPFKPAYVKPPRPSSRSDRTANYGVGLADGKVKAAHEPWFSGMARTYDMRGRRD